jgi:hypothetical protein
LRNVARVLAVVCVKQLCAKLAKRSKAHGLICVLDLACIEYII